MRVGAYMDVALIGFHGRWRRAVSSVEHVPSSFQLTIVYVWRVYVYWLYLVHQQKNNSLIARYNLYFCVTFCL